MSSGFPFICIEGLDGSGKTTIAKRLTNRVGGVYVRTPTEPFASIREVIDSEATAYSRFLFYLAAVSFASSHIEGLLATGAVICDRYIYSTLAYHRAMDDQIKALAVNLPIRMPDYTALLVVDPDERARRLLERAIVQPELTSAVRFEQFATEIAKQYGGLGLRTIDTTGKAVDEVIDIILSDLDVRSLAR